jgi:lysyl-tRNA synthetase class 2
VAALRTAGTDPYPTAFPGRRPLTEVRAAFAPLAPGEQGEEVVRVAGRVAARRGQGKMAFVDLEDRDGRIQLWATADRLGPEGVAAVADLDLGDLIGAWGPVTRTRRGELSLALDGTVMLAKALRPPPDKHAGLRDPETRYRQRYLDLMSDPAARALVLTRARVLAAIRSELEERGFVEVETPVLQPLYGGAAARPFTTHHNALGRDLYLRIATELYLKRCLVGGLERVYEMGKDFRNEGVSHKHTPEFTMLEAYEAYVDYRHVAEMLEHMVARAAVAATGSTTVPWRGGGIDLAPPWPRVGLVPALREASGVDVLEHPEAADLATAMSAAGVEPPPGAGWAKLVDVLLTQALEPTLVRPTLLLDYPVQLSPFAKRRADDPRLVERFEAFAGGMEIANAFTELNDPDDQRERLRAVAAARAAGDDEAEPTDEDFLAALEHGMPPAGGLGLGVDRLVMLLSDRQSIREVVLFPAVRT